MNLVWKPIYVGEISEEEKLSLVRISDWILSRALAHDLVTAAALDSQPIYLILRHGTEEVRVLEARVRPDGETRN
jgi:hypothetical protein